MGQMRCETCAYHMPNPRVTRRLLYNAEVSGAWMCYCKTCPHFKKPRLWSQGETCKSWSPKDVELWITQIRERRYLRGLPEDPNDTTPIKEEWTQQIRAITDDTPFIPYHPDIIGSGTNEQQRLNIPSSKERKLCRTQQLEDWQKELELEAAKAQYEEQVAKQKEEQERREQETLAKLKEKLNTKKKPTAQKQEDPPIQKHVQQKLPLKHSISKAPKRKTPQWGLKPKA